VKTLLPTVSTTTSDTFIAGKLPDLRGKIRSVGGNQHVARAGFG
jgi:hypothetical protein